MLGRIDNPDQLANLRVRYAQVEGALAVAQTARQAAETLGHQYVELLSLLAGVTVPDGAQVRVNWDTGEVNVEQPSMAQNGVHA